MKKLIAFLALVAISTSSIADHRNDHRHSKGDRDLAAAAIIIGSIGAIAIANQQAKQPQIIVQQPPVVYGHPVPVYPQPIYQPRVLTPQPRVMSSHEPCYHYGQMVQTYDQFGHPMGFQVCR